MNDPSLSIKPGGASPTYGLFCRTYAKDAERLAYLLFSIEKFARGFDKVVIAAPKTSLKNLSPIVALFDFAELKECNTWTSDFIAQQITKLTSDRYIDTDYITHIDSDCILVEEMRPEDLFEDGLPVLYHASYEFFLMKNYNMPWQAPTEALLKAKVANEFMRRFPLTYPRALYRDLQAYFLAKHGTPIDEIYNFIEGDLLSEFNMLGAFSFMHGDMYHKHIDQLNEPPRQRHFVKQMCLFDMRKNRNLTDEDLAILIDCFGADEFNKLAKSLRKASETKLSSLARKLCKLFHFDG